MQILHGIPHARDYSLLWHCFVIVLSLFFALLIWVDVLFAPF